MAGSRIPCEEYGKSYVGKGLKKRACFPLIPKAPDGLKMNGKSKLKLSNGKVFGCFSVFTESDDLRMELCFL